MYTLAGRAMDIETAKMISGATDVKPESALHETVSQALTHIAESITYLVNISDDIEAKIHGPKARADRAGDVRPDLGTLDAANASAVDLRLLVERFAKLSACI